MATPQRFAASWLASEPFSLTLELFGLLCLIKFTVSANNRHTDGRVLINIRPELVSYFTAVGVYVQSALEEELGATISTKHCTLDFYADTNGFGFVNIALFGQKDDLVSCIHDIIPWLKAKASPRALEI